MEVLNKNYINYIPNIKNIFCKIKKSIILTTIIIVLFRTQDGLTEVKQEKSNYQLQSELVYNFINHTIWLGQDLKYKNLCVMEDNPMIQYLKILVRNNKNIVVIRKYENDYLDDCQILFIDESYQGYVNRLLFRVKSKPILTFSNIKYFAKIGGIVQFTLRKSRVEFTLNIKEMKSSRIKINEDIISISDVIY